MKEQPIERCGFCGSIFQGDEYLSISTLNKMSKTQIDSLPLGYCPNADAEANSQKPERHQVTRDMAIDAGDPSLEGQWI